MSTFIGYNTGFSKELLLGSSVKWQNKRLQMANDTNPSLKQIEDKEIWNACI